MAQGLKLQVPARWHAPGPCVEHQVCRIVNSPYLSEVKLQGLTEHAKDSVAGFGKILGFRQYARYRKLQVGLAAHAMAFDRVAEHALESRRVHAAFYNVIVRSGSDHFERLRFVINAGDDDNRRVVCGGNQALQALDAVRIRNGEIDQENVD